MMNRLTDNLTGYLSTVLARAHSARDEADLDDLARRVEAEIQKLLERAKNEEASRLAAWLAHKINNPLGAISGSAQLLGRRLERESLDPAASEKCEHYVQSIRTQVERCAGIMNELLENARRACQYTVDEH